MELYEIEASDLARLQAAFAKNPAVVREEMLRAVTEADLLTTREAIDRMPVGAGGASGLKGSVFHVEQATESGALGVVSSPLAYALPVEVGTRPHMPPVEPLVDWVKVKFGISEETTARGIAFAIARKIAVRGTKAQRPFGLTFQAVESQVRGIFEAAGARIAARLGAA